jgi:hypothetical protein
MASREALSGCQALPIAIFFILHFFEAAQFADGLIHGNACFYYTGEVAVALREMTMPQA